MKRYFFKQGFIVQKIGKKITIFEGEKSVLLTLNETASFIFTKMKNNWRVSRIAKKITERYEISEKQSLKDVLDFIKDLELKKIIEPVKNSVLKD